MSQFPLARLQARPNLEHEAEPQLVGHSTRDMVGSTHTSEFLFSTWELGNISNCVPVCGGFHSWRRTVLPFGISLQLDDDSFAQYPSPLISCCPRSSNFKKSLQLTPFANYTNRTIATRCQEVQPRQPQSHFEIGNGNHLFDMQHFTALLCRFETILPCTPRAVLAAKRKIACKDLHVVKMCMPRTKAYCCAYSKPWHGNDLLEDETWILCDAALKMFTVFLYS